MRDGEKERKHVKGKLYMIIKLYYLNVSCSESAYELDSHINLFNKINIILKIHK